MESSAYKWLVSQYRFVLNRMRTHEFMEEHPTCAPAATPSRRSKMRSTLSGTNLNLDRLEDRVMLSSAPVDEALRDLTHAPATKQLFYLATQGANDVDYRGPVAVNDIDIPTFAAPGALKGKESEVLKSMLAALNGAFGSSDIQFTLDRPAGGEFSTIYIGGDNDAFAQYGDYSGVAEAVDAGNQNASDIAFVFTDAIARAGIADAGDYADQLAAVVAHEAGHLIGMAHADAHAPTNAEGPLDDVAWDPKVHVAIGQEAVADVLDDGKVTIGPNSYTVHPKIVQALTNHIAYYNAGVVGPDGFPDSLMGQFVEHAESNATWLTRVLDMAWQAQGSASYTATEQSQILAFAYGYLTHSTGDHWAHTLVNEFTEGVAPGFVKGGVSIGTDGRDLGNMLRHLMTEAYIADAMEGVDTNPDRTALPSGDISDNSTPGIDYAAPIRFIYDALIRAFPDDPTPIVDFDWDGGTLTAVPIANTFVRLAATFGGGLSGLIGDDIKVGHVITVTGFLNPANNGKFRVTNVFPDNAAGNVLGTTFTVQSLDPTWTGLVAETARGGEKIRVYVPKTPKVQINANAAAGTFTRTSGSFVDEGWVAGMRFSAYGFNANFDNFIVKTVTPTTLTVVGKLNVGDTTGSGDEQLVVQGDRGPIINGFFLLRDFIYNKAVSRGDRPAVNFGTMVSQLIDKIVQGQSLPSGFVDDLLTAYLYQWSDSIDDGVRHWGEFGLAFTKAMFDPQSRRDLQNKVGAKFGADTLANTARGNAENAVGMLDVLIEELDDPNGDGSTKDSFLNNHLMAMFGLPPQLGIVRTAVQSFNSLIEGVISDAGEQPFNPTEVTPQEAKDAKPGFIKRLFKKRFGIDFETFEVLSKMHAKMDVKNISLAGNTIPIFKEGDHEKLDAYLGLPANHHKPGAIVDPIPGVDFWPSPEGELADTAHFDKANFAAYKNSIMLTKMALLMETPTDGSVAGSGQLSALYSALSGTAYDAKKLNLHGHHGGNVLTNTLPGVGGTTPWLTSIDADHMWRGDSYTTTTARFRISKQNTSDAPAEWKWTVPAGSYKVYVTWQANVTQDMDNLTNPNHPDQKITPASNAKYTILDDLSSLGTSTQNQKVFAGGFEHNALSYTELGTFNFTSGVVRVRLSNVADGHVIAGPIVIVPAGGGAPIVIQNGRDPSTLTALPPGDDYVDNGTDWEDLVYPTGTGNDPLWESALLRPGFRTLFTDWQNDLLQFPDLGDGTSPDPNTAVIAKSELGSHATPFHPAFTDSVIEIPIPDSLKNALLNGLNKLVDLTKAIETSAPFNVTLPGIDKSIAQILGMSDKVHENVRKPIADYFASDPTPTVGELYDVIKAKIGGDMDNVSPTMEFNVDLRKIFSVADLKIALGQKAADAGLSLEGTLSADASIAFVDALDAALPKLTLGVNLDPNSSTAILDRVYIKADRAILSADIHATNLDLTARLGFLGIGVVDGTFDLSADVQVDFIDPNLDGKITLNEITSTPLADLIDVQADGNLTAALPVQVSAGLNGMTGGTTVGTVDVTAPDLFDLSTYDVQFNGSFTDVLNFNNIDAASLAGLLGKLTYWLDQFRKSDKFKNLDLPLVGPALDQVLKFADAFRDKILIDDNDDDLDGPTTLLHDINAAFAQAGLSDKVRAENDGTGKIKLILNDASISAFTVTGATGLGFGATQTSPAAGVFKSILASGAAPVGGKPAANVTFNISFDGGPATEVRLYKTAGPAPFDAATAVNTSTDRITMTGHGLNTGDLVKYATGGGTGVGGLSSGGTYYVIRIDANTVQLASSLANAKAVTPVAIDLTVVGAGALHTLAHPDNTDDNTTLGNDKWKLVNADNGATFATAQQMVLKLAEIFGSSTLQYHPADETLTFSLNLNETFGSLPLPVNFNFDDLKPLLGLESTGKIVLSADGTLNLTVGVFLGNAPSSTKLDGTEALNTLNDGVHIKSEQLITAATDVKQEFGKLSGDATFVLSINGGADKTVTVLKSNTDNNATVADLVADVNTALTTAGVNAQVQAIAEGLKVVLKGIGSTTAIKLTAEATNPAVRDLGFSAESNAAVVNGVLKIAGRDQLPFSTGRLASNAVFQVSLSTVNGGSPVTVTVNQADTQNNRNLLDVIGDVQKAIDAVPSLKDKIKVASSGRRLTFTAVEPSATSFSITASAANPAVTIFGLAASNVGNSYEFFITLRDGTKHGVTLDGVTTLNGVIAAIVAQVGASNIEVAIDDKQLGLKLRDKTTGPNMFKVEAANGTTAAIDLGILKQDAPTPVEGVTTEAPDGKIEGSAIGGIKLTDRFFIQTANFNIGLHMATPEEVSDGDADTNDGIKATAKFGFVGVELEGGGNVNANFTMGLKDPKTVADDNKITLTELIKALENINTVVNAPALTGGGTIALKVNVNPTLPGLDLGSDPKIVFNITDLGNPFTGDLPSVNLTFPNLGDLVDFDNLNFNFQSIIDGLKALTSFLSDFESFGFLSEPLPLVNISVNDLIGLADKFGQAIEDAESDPAGTLQVLENKIKSAFGIPLTGPGSDLFHLELVNDDNDTASTADDFQILKLNLNLEAAFDQSLNLDFDLGSGFNLGGAADLKAAGSLGLTLDVGLRLDDPSQIYVFDSTGLEGTLNIGGSNLSFNAAAGPLGIFVNGGHANIGGTVDGTKLFKADLSNADFVNGRVAIGDINFGHDFFASVGAGVDVELPVFFPTASIFAGTIHFNPTIGYNTVSKKFTFTGGAPTATDENGQSIGIGQLFAFDPSKLSILDGLLLGVDGVDLFLDGLQDLLNGDLFGFELPLIGDKFSDAADVIGDFRNGFVKDFRAAMEALANPTAAYQQFANSSTSGASGAAGAAGTPQPDPVSKILFQLLGPTGLDLLKDGPDAGSDINQSDIIFHSNIADPGVAPEDLFFDWDFKLGDSIEAGAGIGFDVGIPGLGLETTGKIDFNLDWALNLGFGINMDDGFYFDIANKDADGNKHPELELTADVTVPGGSIKGTLGFLQLSATDNPNGDDTATHLGASFGIDIINRNNANDEKLSFSELGRIGVKAGMSAEAVVDLGAKLSLSSDLIPNAATNFPSIVADFRLEWGFETDDITQIDGGFLKNGLQFVGFEHVGLDLGSYFSDLIGPIVNKVKEITDPIKPFLDFLTTPIPVISDLAGPTTLLDIAALSGAINPGLITAIEVIDKVVDIADGLSGITGDNLIMYFDDLFPDGTFVIYDAAAAGGDEALPDLSDPKLDLSGLSKNLTWLPEELQAALGAVADTVGDAAKKMLPGGEASSGFSLPIIDDPSQIFGMLLGQPAVLVQYDMAPLEVNADFSAFFSIFGPLGVSINAEFKALIDFSFGYDTQGVQDFAASDFRNPALLFNGFFVGDMDAEGKVDVAELQFDAGLWAAAELNLGIARGGVGGGLFAEIDFNLHDPNNDGRVRLSELATNFINELEYGEPALSPLAIFDVTGSLTAKLFAFLKIDLGLFSIDEQFDITPPLELLNFNIPFTRVPTLATDVGDGVLQLNMGQFAAERVEGDKTDGDETFTVTGDSTDLAVTAFGFTQHYKTSGGWKKILGLGGEGNDTIDLSGVTGNIGFELEGNAGDDTIKAGTAATGAGKILGGAGDDHLWGGGGADVVFGEQGNDEIHGGGGVDWLIGDGSVQDSIVDTTINVEVKLNDGADHIFGDDGTDILIGAGGDDILEGGADADAILGDGGKVTVDSSKVAIAVKDTDGNKGGNDSIKGDGGADLIYAGAGNDTVQGGSENDKIFGETGADSIQGEAGNDSIFSGTQNDNVDGGAGDDSISADEGHDTVTGGTENDWISGGTGNDSLAGGGGNDTVFGNSDLDTITGDDGNDFLEGGHGNDTVTGGIGHDTLVAGYGSDILDGQDGNDSYNISARGGSTTESTTAYDSGGLGDTDILTVNGTEAGDTFLLRAMADAYFPTTNDLDHLISKILKSGKAGKLDLLKEGITNRYGTHGVPAGMLAAVETAFNANPIDNSSEAALLTSTNAVIAAVNAAIAGKYVVETKALVHKKIEQIFEANTGTTPEAKAAKFEAISKAIADLYAPHVAVPTAMLDDIGDAIAADANSADDAIAAFDANFVNNALLGQDTAFVALLNDGGAHVERFNYRAMEGLVLNTLHGNDVVATDDVTASTTINLGLGNDRIQIGQVYTSQRDDNPLTANVAPDDMFGTVAITRGFLSNGVSRATVVNGGDGNDEMTVFHNIAVVNLNGGDGDDLFTIRAFALAGSTDSERARTDMKGDGGADTIRYALNAPVGIDGGDGFDTVRVIGTEFSDDFVVTDSGVYGAGLNISYVNIEKLIADGAEGNDRFFVMSTGLGVVTEIDGGLGNDSFFVGGAPGNAPIPVISDDFKGHSGIILNNVESTDPAWQNVKADGVSANIADNEEAFLIVTESDGGSSVTEDATTGGSGVVFDTYKIRLSREPASGKNVLVKLVDAGMPPEDQAKKFKDLEFWDASTATWVTAQNHPGFKFLHGNNDWKNGLEVKFRAAHDDASEGQRFTFINHVTENSTDEDFAGVQTLSVKALINDDDRATVVISSDNNNNTVLEDGFTDKVKVVLTRQPTDNVTVHLTSTNNQISLSATSLVFTPSNWNTQQEVTITALNDTVVEGFHTDFITATVTSDDTDKTKSVALAQVDADLLLPGVQAILPEKATSFVFLEHKPDLTQPVKIVLDLTTIQPLGEGEITPEIRYTITGNTLTFIRNGNAVAVSGTVKAEYKYIERGYDGLLVKDTAVDIYDNDAAMVIVTQSDGSTDVLEGGFTDKYTVVLSKAPAAGKTVTIKVDAIKTRTTLDGDAEFKEQVTVNGLSATEITFTDANWNVPQEVTVAAIDDGFQDGSETQVFAPQLNTVNKIRGPLIIEGAAGAGSLSLPDPLMLPGELNVRESHGTVKAFTPSTGGGAIETMIVDKQDLLDHLADVDVASLAKLVGKTIELTKGPGTDVILDAARPRDLYDRFWLITQLTDLGNGTVQLKLQNPTMVDPGQPNVTAPTTATEFAITSLSVNFFVDERTSVDYTTVFDQDSVADDTGLLTSSDGNVLSFTPSGGATETMNVETSDLQHLGLADNNFDLLKDKILEITVGPGKGRKWIIKAVENTTDGQVKKLTLEKLSGGSGNPTDRSEFRVDGFDRHGRILGLGMGPNVIIGEGVQPGGITYGDMEVLAVNLGNGNDTIDVDYTTNAEGHTTKRSGDFYTLTMLNLGAGNDTVNAKLDAAQDGDIAIRGQAGNDTINATGSTLGITAFGEEGNDTITGGGGQDSIFGDFGRVDFVDAEGEIITRLGHSIPLNPVNPPVVSATANTITDPTANFTTEYGGLVGLMMQVIAPDGHVQFRRIIANTATTITVDHAWDTMPITGQLEPDENSAYRISALPEDQGDGTYRGPRVVWSIDNGIGGNDVINGGDGADLLVGGAANDAIDAGAGADIVGGDNIRVDFTPVTGTDGPTKVVQILETGVGGADSINAGGDADVVIAGLGNDTVNGQTGNDVLVGDRGDIIYKADGVTIDSIETTDRANGGDDRIYGNEGDDVVVGGAGSDALDGGTEKDLVVGDNVKLVNNVGSADAIKGRFRTVAGATMYNATGQPNVSAPVTNIANKPGWADWTITLDQTLANFGNDYIAGGAGDDEIFGQLGNDTVQGDGSIDITVSQALPSVEAATDGDDYIEGNAGNDLIFGNLGQDDLIGGSSNLFSLTTPALRGDGSDVIFGGAGTDLARNNLGDTGNTAHSRDADFIIGDNGNIYRLVDSAGNYRTFTYDNYGPLKLIPRSVQHLDYTYGGNVATDIGAADLIHGESGDDSVYGTVGNDVLFGEGQDDDIYGGIGHDRIYGGSGEDGVIGDDGLIFTSRNGLTETLNGVNTVNGQIEIFTSGKDTGAWVYITGRLNKSVQLLAYELGGNDVVYGGLGDDFLHAGQGNDAVSGAEALASFYNDAPVTNTTPLVYDPATRKLAGFDANNPRAKVANFLLNFEASVGGVKIEDGKDRIFGDLGHDWLMGGTGNDRIFGGRGDDVMNADDNLDTPTGNDVPDAPAYADADFVYGGDGLDVLIGNTGKDRLFDWSGEFNSFFVPFSQFGAPTVNRLIMPGVPEFLIALGAESGADRTRIEPDGELGLYRQGDPVWNQNTGNPRDPQPGTSKAKIDTVGGREDDRNTALPL